jgi:ATP-binding cassette subfamily C (CFTR/MRP) protein 1
MIEVLKEKEGNPSVENNVSFLSKFTYSWLNDLFLRGMQQPLGKEDLFELDFENHAEFLCDKLEGSWAKDRRRKGSASFPILAACLEAFGSDFYLAGFWLLLNNAGQILSPIIIRYLLIWLSSPDDAVWWPYTLICTLLVLQLLCIWSYNYQFELAAKTGFRLRTALSMLLFKKFFKLSNASRQIYSVGKIVNISSTDTLKIDMAIQYFNLMWTSLFLLVASFSVLFYFLGISVLGAFILVFCYLPVQYYLSKANATFRRAANIFLDQRMRIISESLKGIRVIKAYAWEKSFMKSIRFAVHL